MARIPSITKSDLLSTTTANFFGFLGIDAFVAVTFVGLFIGRFFPGFIPDKLGLRVRCRTDELSC